MKNRAKKPLSLLTFFSILLFGSIANAMPTTFEIITGSQFVGKTTGSEGDIFWEGGTNDANLVDFPCCDATTSGLNTVGSSAITFNFVASSGAFFSQGFEVGNTIFNNPLQFGENVVSSISRQSEFLFNGDGVSTDTSMLDNISPSINTINPNNTGSSLTFSETADFNSVSDGIFYYLTSGQNPNDIFSDASLFAGVNPLVTQQGVIDQFNYLINDVVAPDWTALSFNFFTFEGAAKAGSGFEDITGLGFSSFVSFDESAIIENPVSVAEPSTYMLFGLGMIGLLGFSRKKVEANIS